MDPVVVQRVEKVQRTDLDAVALGADLVQPLQAVDDEGQGPYVFLILFRVFLCHAFY